MVNITEKRIRNLINELYGQRYEATVPLEALYTADKNPIPYEEVETRSYNKIELGTKWGEFWDSAWFRFSGNIPSRWKGKEVVALIDIGGEGCVYKNGIPYCGITYKRTETLFERKRRIPLYKEAYGGEDVSLLVEGAANGLFGDMPLWSTPWPFFRLNQAELAIFNSDIWALAMDLDFLLQLYNTMNPDLPRAKRILRGLNKAANLTPVTENVTEARIITQALINTPSSSSELTAWSVGHAHMDLAWLWRFRETRRKAGRTFSTALRLMEEYPDYVFGASQPQLFQWVKEDYPELYSEVKEAVKTGKMECQGGMWVEPDMNLTGGESLVRQCLYGKRFFKEEFGIDMRNLWLPDVFGYSAALPQILKKSGIDFFMTQKISWNEYNTFPHHTFLWSGIDGTEILSHFLPANNYNCSNEPQLMANAALRFSQSDIHDGFLNLYGIGDGGGGPSRRHIEWAVRSRDCEGIPKIKMAKAEEFFEYIEEKGTVELPRWKGELYLEMHRGTYTAQAEMKKYNRLLELKLRDIEFLGSLTMADNGMEYPADEIERIWKDTLLNQFHDVLPGSSIREVYKDAIDISRNNLHELTKLKERFLLHLFPDDKDGAMTFINTQPWERTEICEFEGREVAVTVPSLGAVSCSAEDLRNLESSEKRVSVSEDGFFMENEKLRVSIDGKGTISSIYLKEMEREMLGPAGAGNFILYEDKPYVFDAWEVSPYYRETLPETAVLKSRKVVHEGKLFVRVEQHFIIGLSDITEVLELRSGESIIRSKCIVNWRETHKMLRLVGETDLSRPAATYEIQYGTIERPTHSNTSWDEAQFEVCGHRFADLSQSDRGMALINDCKYGYRIHGSFMELNLLRSPLYPDPQCDRGTHEFSFAYMPHAGMLKDSRVFQASHNFNSPLLLVRDKVNEKKSESSWFSVDSDQVCIEVIKPAENGEGIILRAYETSGGACRCNIRTENQFEKVWEVNLLEEVGNSVNMEEPGKLSADFKPYEIKTFLWK